MMRETAVLYLQLITDFLTLLAREHGFMSRYHPLVEGIAQLTAFIRQYDALEKHERPTLIDAYYEQVCKVSDLYTELREQYRKEREHACYTDMQRSGQLDALLEAQPEAWAWVRYMEDTK